MKVFEDDEEGQQEARKLAKRNCKDCHGRGYLTEVLGGRKITDETPRRKVLCGCAVKTLARWAKWREAFSNAWRDIGEAHRAIEEAFLRPQSP